jgi:hypothetical protein
MGPTSCAQQQQQQQQLLLLLLLRAMPGDSCSMQANPSHPQKVCEPVPSAPLPPDL